MTTAAGHIAAWDPDFRILRLTEWSRRTATNCRPIIESSRRRFRADSIMNTVSRRPRERRQRYLRRTRGRGGASAGRWRQGDGNTDRRHGSLAALTAVILVSLLYNPRIWINDAPARVRKLAPPLTVVERRARAVAGVLLLLTLAAVTSWSATKLLGRHGAALSLGTAIEHFVGVFFLFNLFDLIVIDWLILLVLRPRMLRLSVPGLSYEETVGNYGYHFRGFIIGLGFVAMAGLVAALMTYAVKLARF
jgi:hypothetical protein